MEVQGREGGPSASVPGCPQHVIPAGLQDSCLSMPQPVQEGHCPSLTILPPCQVTSKLGDQPESQVSPQGRPSGHLSRARHKDCVPRVPRAAGDCPGDL